MNGMWDIPDVADLPEVDIHCGGNTEDHERWLDDQADLYDDSERDMDKGHFMVKPQDIAKHIRKKRLVFAEWMEADGYHLVCLNNVPPIIVHSIVRDAKLNPNKYKIFKE